MKRNFKRIIAWLLVLTIMGSNTLAVFAEELSDGFTSEDIILEDVSAASVEESVQEVLDLSISSDDLTSGELIEEPTVAPVEEPTAIPTEEPTAVPEEEPTEEPAEEPTMAPSEVPTVEPTIVPPAEPTDGLIIEPTDEPTVALSEESITAPTEEPTADPTEEPSTASTEEPSADPVDEPTAEQTAEPTETPALKFEQGYVRVSSGTTVYKSVWGEETGRFLSDSYVYGVVEYRTDELADDWLKITFDTAYNRDNGIELYEGYVKGNLVEALSEADSDKMNDKASQEQNARSYRGFYLPAAQYEEYAIKEADVGPAGRYGRDNRC